MPYDFNGEWLDSVCPDCGCEYCECEEDDGYCADCDAYSDMCTCGNVSSAGDLTVAEHQAIEFHTVTVSSNPTNPFAAVNTFSWEPPFPFSSSHNAPSQGETDMPQQVTGLVMPIRVAISLSEMFPMAIMCQWRGAQGDIYYPDRPRSQETWQDYRERVIRRAAQRGITYLYGYVVGNDASCPRIQFSDELTWTRFQENNYGYPPLEQEHLKKVFEFFNTTPVSGSDLQGRRCLVCGLGPGPASIDRHAAFLRQPDLSVLCTNCILALRSQGSFGPCEECRLNWRYTWTHPDTGRRCSGCGPTCGFCEQSIPSQTDLAFISGTACCYSCYSDHAASCYRCGTTHPRVEMVYDLVDLHAEDSDSQYFCQPCHVIHARQLEVVGRSPDKATFLKDASWTEQRGTDRTFGVEIEAHFDTSEIPISEYHSGRQAGKPLFSHWRAERDGSIFNGGEIISPVLKGPDGVAEVLATMKVLRELEASVTGACGQHVHIGTTARLGRLEILMGCLEDFAIGITGSFRRWGNSYTPRVKNRPDELSRLARNYHGSESDNLTPLLQSSGPLVEYGDRGIVGRSQIGTTEFRYPPGTLNGTQFVLNHGFINLVTELAETKPASDIGEWAKAWVKLGLLAVAEGSASSEGGPWVHNSILEAAKFVREIGDWHPGGEWRGFAFHPNKDGGKEIVVVDAKRDFERTVKFPTEKDLLTRLDRQIQNFYRSAHRISGWWSEKEGREKADEVVEVFAG